jgi:hypothetical protein
MVTPLQRWTATRGVDPSAKTHLCGFWCHLVDQQQKLGLSPAYSRYKLLWTSRLVMSKVQKMIHWRSLTFIDIHWHHLAVGQKPVAVLKIDNDLHAIKQWDEHMRFWSTKTTYLLNLLPPEDCAYQSSLSTTSWRSWMVHGMINVYGGFWSRTSWTETAQPEWLMGRMFRTLQVLTCFDPLQIYQSCSIFT